MMKPRLRLLTLVAAAIFTVGCTGDPGNTPVPISVQSRKAVPGSGLPDLPEIAKPANCGGYVALTFDDGPTDLTDELLTILTFYDIPATFFNLGIAELDYPRLVERTVEDKFVVGNHTMTHADLLKDSFDKAEGEIVDFNKVHVQLGFDKPRLFRPPYGSTSPKIQKFVEKNDMTVVLWTLDSKDFETPDFEKVIVQSQGMKDGGVLLMHDGKPQTLKALPKIIENYYAQGLCFGKITPTENEIDTPLGIPMKARATEVTMM